MSAKFLIFEVTDPAGIQRHSRTLGKGTRFAIKRSSSRVHVDRWLAKRRLREIKSTRAGVCLICGCTDADCSSCIAKTGEPCSWANAEQTLCTACL